MAEDSDGAEINDGSEEVTEYAVFETNHPYMTTRVGDQMDEIEQLHLASRMLHRYYPDRNWIEQGFQNSKPRLMRTYSDCPRFRFYCFLFGTIQHSVWRVIDLLVRYVLSTDTDRVDSPKVQLSTFLSFASKVSRGLDPPG